MSDPKMSLSVAPIIEYGAFGVLVVVLLWFMVRLENIIKENTITMKSFHDGQLKLAVVVEAVCKSHEQVLKELNEIREVLDLEQRIENIKKNGNGKSY